VGADSQYGHSSVVDPIGNVIAEADEKEAIVYADIGELLACGVKLRQTRRCSRRRAATCR
jgi:predicted amidohydrolase